MVLNTEAVAQRCFEKKRSVKFQKIHRKKPVIESLKGEILAQAFSCEFWEICRNTFLIEHLRWLLLSIRLWTTKMAFSITIQMTLKYILAQRFSSAVLNRQRKWVINLTFPLIQIMSCSKSTSHHLLFCRANAAWYAVEKEKNEIIKSMTRQVFLICLSFRIAFLFDFWESVLFTS